MRRPVADSVQEGQVAAMLIALFLLAITSSSADGSDPYRSCSKRLAIAGPNWAVAEIRTDLAHARALARLTYDAGPVRLTWKLGSGNRMETARPLEVELTQRLPKTTRFPVDGSLLVNGRAVWGKRFDDASLQIVDLDDPITKLDRKPGWVDRASYPGISAKIVGQDAPSLIGATVAQLLAIDAAGTQSSLVIPLPDWSSFLGAAQRAFDELEERRARLDCDIVQTIVVH
jgi:hypothetical protein